MSLVLIFPSNRYDPSSRVVRVRHEPITVPLPPAVSASRPSGVFSWRKSGVPTWVCRTQPINGSFPVELVWVLKVANCCRRLASRSVISLLQSLDRAVMIPCCRRSFRRGNHRSQDGVELVDSLQQRVDVPDVGVQLRDSLEVAMPASGARTARATLPDVRGRMES